MQQTVLEARSNHGNSPKVQSIYKEVDSLLTDAKKANITSNPYLEPNSHSMQKPIEGLLVLPVFHFKKLSQNKKTEGKGTNKTIGAYPKAQPIKKGAIVFDSAAITA